MHSRSSQSSGECRHLNRLFQHNVEDADRKIWPLSRWCLVGSQINRGMGEHFRHGGLEAKGHCRGSSSEGAGFKEGCRLSGAEARAARAGPGIPYGLLRVQRKGLSWSVHSGKQLGLGRDAAIDGNKPNQKSGTANRNALATTSFVGDMGVGKNLPH